MLTLVNQIKNKKKKKHSAQNGPGSGPHSVIPACRRRRSPPCRNYRATVTQARNVPSPQASRQDLLPSHASHLDPSPRERLLWIHRQGSAGLDPPSGRSANLDPPLGCSIGLDLPAGHATDMDPPPRYATGLYPPSGCAVDVVCHRVSRLPSFSTKIHARGLTWRGAATGSCRAC